MLTSLVAPLLGSGLTKTGSFRRNNSASWLLQRLSRLFSLAYAIFEGIKGLLYYYAFGCVVFAHLGRGRRCSGTHIATVVIVIGGRGKRGGEGTAIVTAFTRNRLCVGSVLLSAQLGAGNQSFTNWAS